MSYHLYHPWDWYISLRLVDCYGFQVGIHTVYGCQVLLINTTAILGIIATKLTE